MVLRRHGLGAAAMGIVTLLAATAAARAQDATQLPGVIVDNAPPPPISKPSARDPGPAAQARSPQKPKRARTTAAPAQASPAASAPAPSQTAANSEPAAPAVVTPNRGVQQIGNVASAVTVIGPTQIERARAAGATVLDLLRGTPGLTIRRNGGPGSGAEVNIRGADGDQTLVMIDGVPVNDPASAAGDFDFAVLSLANVARIEILRGPQSGIYGADAIGGVINIITRRGRGKPSRFVEAEVGSYGTAAQRTGVSGRSGRVSYALGASNFYSSGFSRRADDDEKDATRKQAVAANFGYALSATSSIEARLGYYRLRSEIDQSSTRYADDGNTFNRDLFDSALTARFSNFGGIVSTKLTAFANRTERNVRECRDLTCTSVQSTDYNAVRTGLEATTTVKLRDGRDRFVFGGRLLRQSGERVNRRTGRTPSVGYDIVEDHQAAYAAYTFNPFDAFTFNASVRFDDFDTGKFETTYRLAAAYRIESTGTKFRASYGTGIKAPTIFQRFETSAGNADLSVERSRGYDVGVDQSLFAGAFVISATYFNNDIQDLIVFTGDFLTGSYKNVSRVETSGVELGGEWRPAGWIRFRASYTYLDATDATTGARLRRRPEQVAKATVAIEPFAGLHIAATVLHQSSHYNADYDPNQPDKDLQKVDGYTRFDLSADYAFNKATTLFVRAENLTDVEYQEVRSFNTPGRSAYVGMRIRF